MTVSQREKLALLGGAEWLRSKIDKAKTPNGEAKGRAWQPYASGAGRPE
jgi:hypothetical protein